MLQKIVPFFLLILLISCSSDDSTASCKLMSVKVGVLFQEEMQNPFVTPYDPNSSGRLTFIYGSNNKISEVHGGVLLFPPGQSLMTWMYHDSVVDLVTYSQDTVKVHFNSGNPSSRKKKFFKIRNGKVVYRKDMDNIYTNEYTYTYSGNTINETMNGQPYRTFTMVDGNLVSVERLYYNSTNQIAGKKEYRFMNYDNSQNLLKGMFYVSGAFFTAFSDNNYQRLEINNYTYSNGIYTLNGNGYSQGPPFTYDENNIADVFEQSCD